MNIVLEFLENIGSLITKVPNKVLGGVFLLVSLVVILGVLV